MLTFWPTVGTVLRRGEGWSGLKRALTCSWKVVLPALSRPRRMTEYSAWEVSGLLAGERMCVGVIEQGWVGWCVSCLLCLSREGRGPSRGGT